MASNLKITADRVRNIKTAFMELAKREILVGFPSETATRDESGGPTNASLGYIHDTGMPEQNIPARPFMIPGILSVQTKAADALEALAKKAVADPSPLTIDRGLHRVGSIAELGLKKKINEGVPPPLADSTLRERARRGTKGRKGAKLELELRAAGWAPSVDFAKPLIDTGQLRNAIKYVIRDRKKRRA